MASKNIMKELRQVPSKKTALNPSDFTLTDNVTGEESTIAEFQTKVPLGLRPGRPVELRIVAYESFSTPGDSSTDVTKNLSNEVIDNDHVANDVLVYQGGSIESTATVDYSANSITFDDDGSNNTLHVYYLVGDQAPVEIRKVAPKNFQEEMISADASLANMRDQYKDPITFDPKHDLQGIVPKDWKVQVTIDSAYAINWEDDADGTEATNMALDLPIRKAGRNIEGLEQAVKDAIRG